MQNPRTLKIQFSQLYHIYYALEKYIYLFCIFMQIGVQIEQEQYEQEQYQPEQQQVGFIFLFFIYVDYRSAVSFN